MCRSVAVGKGPDIRCSALGMEVVTEKMEVGAGRYEGEKLEVQSSGGDRGLGMYTRLTRQKELSDA